MRHASLLLLLFAAACEPTPVPAPSASAAGSVARSGSAVVVSASAPRASGSVVTSAQPPKTSAADTAFEALATEFLNGYFERQPVRATEAGEHRFDGKWSDPSEAGDAAYKTFIADIRKKLATIDSKQLSAQNRVDSAILVNQLDLMEFSLDELRPAENDPLYYTALIGDGVDPLMTREFASAEVRAKSLASRLEGIPAIVEIAKKRLKKPPKVHTETAIIQNAGLVEAAGADFKELGTKVPGEKARIDEAAKKAQEALADFQKFLKDELLPRSDGEFRIGKERFQKKLALYLDDPLDAATQAKEAEAFLKQTQLDMVETAKELWPEISKDKPWKDPTSDAEKKAVVREALAKLAEERSTDTTIVADAEATLKAATAFVREKDLVRVPDEPCRIIEMPEYRRGVAIAYCDAAGPLEPKPETFYAISPTPKGWPAKRVESYYREYNKAMLNDLTVHEAMPGHFLQLMHNNKFPSKLRAVFSHGAFVEGWAVYTEWLMAKHGFGGARVRMQRQKMALRMSANAMLDFGIHAGEMTEKDAMKLMMDEAFQEEGEAVGKWRRACLTSAQLTTYYYGYSQMAKLRKANEGKPGFTERSYHDKLLSFGSPPPRHVAGLLEN